MPEDYEYLKEKLGQDWGGLPGSGYSPTLKSGSTIDWKAARNIYDEAMEYLSAPPKDVMKQGWQIACLDGKSEELIDALEPEFRLMLLKKLGEE